MIPSNYVTKLIGQSNSCSIQRATWLGTLSNDQEALRLKYYQIVNLIGIHDNASFQSMEHDKTKSMQLVLSSSKSNASKTEGLSFKVENQSMKIWLSNSKILYPFILIKIFTKKLILDLSPLSLCLTKVSN